MDVTARAAQAGFRRGPILQSQPRFQRTVLYLFYSFDYSVTANTSVCCGRHENHSRTIFTSLLALSISLNLSPSGVDLVRPLPKCGLRLVLPCGPRQGVRPGPASMTANSPCLKRFSILVHWVERCGPVPCLALVSSFLLSNDKRESKGVV